MEETERDHSQRLWLIAAKLAAIGELLKNWNGEAFGTENDLLYPAYGLGMLVTELAREIADLSKGP